MSQLTVIKTALTTYSIDALGHKQGKQQIFEPDGTIKEEINWTDDVKDGDHTIWYDGRIIHMKPYKMGTLDGVEINWSERTTWVQGVKEGPFKDDSRDYPAHGTYKNGQLHGPCYSVHVGNNGPETRHAFYNEGLMHGECVELRNKHSLIKQGVYINGELMYNNSEEYQIAVAMGKESEIVPLQESFGQYLAKDNSVLLKQRLTLYKSTVNAIQKQVTDVVSSVNTQNNNITIIVNV